MDKKFIESINISDYSILTDSGYEKVNKLHKTIPYEVYELKLVNGMNLKCADSHVLFNKKGKEIFLKDLKNGDLIPTDLGLIAIESIESLGYKENMYDFELTNSINHRYFTNGILSHNTVIAHGLAQKIVNQDCSPLLQNKRIVELDVAALVAGTKYRGQFEERLKSIMREVEDNPDIVLFIDEVHTIIGAGSASGSGDASNMIKPALSNGKMQLIGITTLDEYRKTIEKDGALNRRFQKVILDPPSSDETIIILTQIKDQYEKHHSVSYSTEVIVSIVKLAERYLAHLQFPDKAIDIMDEVGAFVRGESLVMSMPQNILDIDAKLVLLKNEKDLIVKQQKYEEAAKLRDIEKKLADEVILLKEDWIRKVKEEILPIIPQHVATIVSSLSGVPVTKLTSDENTDLLNLEDKIKEHVIGQDKAVYLTVKEIQKARLGIKDPNKPSVLLYLGTTGVGKCFSPDTQVVMKNKRTGEIKILNISELITLLKPNNPK